MIIGLLHPGAMGAAVGAQLVGGGHRVGWLPDGRSAVTTRRAEAAGLVAAGSLAELLDSEVVFSICPPAAASSVADAVVAAGFTGTFVEANAINPARMTSIAGRLRSAGATVVDGAIIGPPPGVVGGRELAARVYLSGPADAVESVAGLLAGSLAVPKRLDERIGSASALKMAYGSYQKISRALAAVSHALADDWGVTPALLAEAQRMGPGALADRDGIAAAAIRGWRWAPEMDEVAESLRTADLPDALAAAGALLFRRWDADKDDRTLTTEDVLRHLRITGEG